MESWYALRTRVRTEVGVARNLSGKGYECFLPTYERKRNWSDRIKTVELPLFPGYLFCRFDVTRRLPILMAPGVNSIVGIAGVPTPIDTQEIESIRTVVQSSAAYEPHPYVSIGQMVQIKEGVFAGLSGFVMNVKNERRLIISVQLLMRAVAVEIDRMIIEPISEQNKPLCQIVPSIPKRHVA